MKMISVTQAAKLIKRDPSRIRLLCSQGRIPGAVKIGWSWVLPQNFTISPTKLQQQTLDKRS